MKSYKIAVSMLLVVLCWSTMAFANRALAIDFRDIRSPHLYGKSVVDRAELLSLKTEQQLNRLLSKLETQTTAEMIVVTVPDTQPSETPKQFATSLFNYWRIGKSGKDNGVLFLVSRDDRRLEIETGYGIESILPNDRVAALIDEQILPQFKQGDFDGGTLAGTQALAMALGYRQAAAQSQTSSGIPYGPISAAILVAAMVIAANWRKGGGHGESSNLGVWSGDSWGGSGGDGGGSGGDGGAGGGW